MNFDVHPVYLSASVTRLCLCRGGTCWHWGGHGLKLLTSPPSLDSLLSGATSSSFLIRVTAIAPNWRRCLHSCPSPSLLSTQQLEESVRNVNRSTLLLCSESLRVSSAHSVPTDSSPWIDRSQGSVSSGPRPLSILPHSALALLAPCSSSNALRRLCLRAFAFASCFPQDIHMTLFSASLRSHFNCYLLEAAFPDSSIKVATLSPAILCPSTCVVVVFFL